MEIEEEVEITDKMKTDEAMTWYASLNPIERAEIDTMAKELADGITNFGCTRAIEVIYKVKRLLVRKAIKAL